MTQLWGKALAARVGSASKGLVARSAGVSGRGLGSFVSRAGEFVWRGVSERSLRKGFQQKLFQRFLVAFLVVDVGEGCKLDGRGPSFF